MPALTERSGFRALSDVPCAPGGWPVLGHLHQLDPKVLHRVLEGWREHCGDVFRFGMGPKTVFVTADPEHAQAALRERPEHFRRLGAIEPVLRDMGIDSVFSVEGERWRPQRKLVMQALAPHQLPHYLPTLRTITRRLLQRWRSAAQQAQPIDAVHDLTRFTVDVTSSLSFGRDVNTLESPADAIQQHLGVVFPAVNRRINFPLPYWRWFKLPADHALERSLQAIRGFVDGLILQAREERRRRPDAPPSNLLQALLQASEEPGSGITDADVRANVIILLLAGEDTTAHALAWTLFLLADRPDLQDRLAAEADAALGAADVAPDLAALQALPLCEGMVFEALRLRPVVPIIFLETVGERVLGGVMLPPGTPVFVLTRPAALDERHFHQPLDLQPQRWQPGRSAQAVDSRAFLQFGAGPRVCPGRQLATAEMRLVLSMALRHFRFSPAGDRAAVREQFGFTMMPSAVPLRVGVRGA